MKQERIRAAIRHPVVQNVLAYGSGQVALTVVPLITLPFLARVLDRSQFGLVIFVQTFSFLVALLVNYGFNLSATREVARRRHDPAPLSSAVSGVLGAQLLLAVASAVLSLTLWPVVPIFSQDPELLGYGVALGILQGWLPVWFFLGIERSQVVALGELASRLLALGLIVALVREPDDAGLVLLIYTVSAAASTGILIALVLRRVTRIRFSGASTQDALRRGRTLLAGTGATALYTGANAFVLGLLVPAGQVAIFAAAEKVVRAGSRVLGLTTAAVYPRVSLLLSRGDLARANRLSTLSVGLFAGAAVVGAAVLAIWAPLIVGTVFGSRFEGSIPLLRTLALLLPLNVLGFALSTQWLLPRRLDRWVTTVLLCACVLNAVVLVAATELFGLRAAAWAVVSVELFVVLGNLIALRRFRARGEASRGLMRPEVSKTEGAA
jgi:PST family polysaccharide transporter